MNRLTKELIDKGLLSIANDISEQCGKLNEDEMIAYLKDKFNIFLNEDGEYVFDDALSDIELEYGQHEFNEPRDTDIIVDNDVENARNMYKETMGSDDKFLSRFVNYFSIAIIVIGFGYLYVASFTTIADSNMTIVQSTTEFIKNILIMVTSFWVGSSVGSKLKTNKMAEMSNRDFDF